MLTKIPNLSLSLEVADGADIDQAIRDAVVIANTLKIFVSIAPNGIDLLIKPDENPDDVIAEWEYEFASK